MSGFAIWLRNLALPKRNALTFTTALIVFENTFKRIVAEMLSMNRKSPASNGNRFFFWLPTAR